MHYTIGVYFNLPYFFCCSNLEHVSILHTRHGGFVTNKDLILFSGVTLDKGEMSDRSRSHPKIKPHPKYF
jgi:hypothetical protein